MISSFPSEAQAQRTLRSVSPADWHLGRKRTTITVPSPGERPMSRARQTALLIMQGENQLSRFPHWPYCCQLVLLNVPSHQKVSVSSALIISACQAQLIGKCPLPPPSSKRNLLLTMKRIPQPLGLDGQQRQICPRQRKKVFHFFLLLFYFPWP